MTYNGHQLKEFVPQKTAAYISQNDVHVGEMTVKETLDFSARCQGVGSRYGRSPIPSEMSTFGTRSINYYLHLDVEITIPWSFP